MKVTPHSFKPDLKNEPWRFSGLKALSDAQIAGLATQAEKTQKIDVVANGSQTEVVRLEAREGLCAKSLAMSVGLNAHLDFVLVNDLPQGVYNFNFLEILAAAGAKVNVTVLNFGAAYTRQEITAKLQGEGAEVNLRSLTLAGGTTEVDQRTLQLHEAAGAKSNLLFKNILDERAHAIFGGNIRVVEGAQKTDAYQKNLNLVLSATAVAHSLPGLEIGADDVKCSHGATVGSLDENQLFYLQSRGIPDAESKRLLLAGFAEEILAGLPADVKKWAEGRLGFPESACADGQ